MMNMKSAIARVGITFVILIFLFAFLAFLPIGYPLRGNLDKIWEHRMLYENFGSYYAGEWKNGGLEIEPDGKTTRASISREKLVIQDQRGKKFFGFMQGGGWDLTGGRIAKVKFETLSFELYAKEIKKRHPSFWDNYYHKKETAYDFFLIKRDIEKNQSVILKKWNIPPEQVVWRQSQSEIKYRGERDLYQEVKGTLTLINESNEIEVSLTGLDPIIVERFKIE